MAHRSTLGCSELNYNMYKFIVQNWHIVCCFLSPWQRNNQSTEITSLEDRVGWLQSDCAQQSPWQEPHILHIYYRTHTHITTARYTKTFSCTLSNMDTQTHWPADERFDAFASDRSHAHRHGLRRCEPVGIVITRGKVTHIVDVAEEEWHGAELPQAATSRTCEEKQATDYSFGKISNYLVSYLFGRSPICFIHSGNVCATLTQVLAMRSLISLHIQERVPIIDWSGALWTQGHFNGLTVPSH